MSITEPYVTSLRLLHPWYLPQRQFRYWRAKRYVEERSIAATEIQAAWRYS